MTREQMFGSEWDGVSAYMPGTVTVYFLTKPRLVPAADCGPDDHACRLRTLEEGRFSMGRYEYDLCPNHTRWWRRAP